MALLVLMVVASLLGSAWAASSAGSPRAGVLLGVLAFITLCLTLLLAGWSAMRARALAGLTASGRPDDGARQVEAHGRRFAGWFAAQQLAWGVVGLMLAAVLLLPRGATLDLVLAAVGGLLTVTACALAGALSAVRPLATDQAASLAACWRSPIPHGVSRLLARTEALLLLPTRLAQVRLWDAAQPQPMLRKIVQVREDARRGRGGFLLDVRPAAGVNWRAELPQRAAVYLVIWLFGALVALIALRAGLIAPLVPALTSILGVDPLPVVQAPAQQATPTPEPDAGGGGGGGGAGAGQGEGAGSGAGGPGEGEGQGQGDGQGSGSGQGAGQGSGGQGEGQEQGQQGQQGQGNGQGEGQGTGQGQGAGQGQGQGAGQGQGQGAGQGQGQQQAPRGGGQGQEGQGQQGAQNQPDQGASGSDQQSGQQQPGQQQGSEGQGQGEQPRGDQSQSQSQDGGQQQGQGSSGGQDGQQAGGNRPQQGENPGGGSTSDGSGGSQGTSRGGDPDAPPATPQLGAPTPVQVPSAKSTDDIVSIELPALGPAQPTDATPQPLPITPLPAQPGQAGPQSPNASGTAAEGSRSASQPLPPWIQSLLDGASAP